MNEQVYQDIKAALEKIGDKVPATWELLVRERMHLAICNLAVMVPLLLLLGWALLWLFRWGKRQPNKNGEVCGDAVMIVSGLGIIGVAIAVFLMVLFSVQTIAAPNVSTVSWLLRR